MTAVLIGILFVVLGAWGMVTWFEDLMVVVRGLAPVSILVGGVVAVVAGLATLRPQRRDGSKS